MQYNPLSSSEMTSSSHGFLADVDADDVEEGGQKGSKNINADSTKKGGHGSDEELLIDENSTTLEKLKVLISLAAPVVVSFFIGIGANFINFIFAGHHSSSSGRSGAVFAGVSLASMFINVSCMSILIGMTAAVETLGSQNNGAGNYEVVGYILQRSCLVLYVICIPILILWCFTRDIFTPLGLEPEVVDVLVTFVKIRAFSLPIDVINESYEKYLMSIGVMSPSMWANILFSLFLLFFDSLFTFVFKMDYRGLAYAWVISVYLQSGVQYYLSLRFVEVQRTLQPLNFSKAWEDVRLFVELGIPGTVMLCSEWWAYEFLTMMASMIGTADVAAQTIIIQVASLAFMIPLGIGIATSSLVGNAIGAGKIVLSKEISHLSIALISTVEIFVGVVIYCFGLNFMQIFTSNEKILEVAEKAIPFLSIFTFFDGLQGVTSGILRGVGKQTIGACANVVAFYAIGLPCAYMICFKWGLGVRGLMMGISVGTLFQVSVSLALIFVFSTYLFTPLVKDKSGSEESISDGSSIGNDRSDSDVSSTSNNNSNSKSSNYKNSSSKSDGNSDSDRTDVENYSDSLDPRVYKKLSLTSSDSDNVDDLDDTDMATLNKLSGQIEMSSWDRQ